MFDIILGVIVVLLVIFIVPIIVYGLFSTYIGSKMPDGISPLRFLMGVFVSKFGTAITFVLLFYFGRDIWVDKWLMYATIWSIMFVIGEIGQTVGPNYSWKEAIAGVISEAIYFPLSAYLLVILIHS